VNHVSDGAIERLRAIADAPDFSGTRYELRDSLGRGGMGVVFRARDRELDRDVAIKVTMWATAADAERLRAEARTLAALEHPGIVPIHDVGRLPDGRVFTVMMLVRGERLDGAAATLPLSDRLRLFDRVCDAVSFAHARGVVHCDLKPSNVMVGTFGRVFVLDWGGGATEGYTPPEQMGGAAYASGDVYALGAILRDLTAGADLGSRFPRPLQSIIARATGLEPASRYESVSSLAADVRRCADGLRVLAHRETAVERAVRLGRAYRTPLALVLAYLALRILFIVWGRGR
jgi:serine/threonine protein kinase